MRFPASKTFILHRNVDHRAACLALYRRLLKHAQNVASGGTNVPQLEENDEDTRRIRNTVKSIIVKEFKKYQKRDFKVSQIRDALKLGYKAEYTLRKVAGEKPDPVELARMTMFINLYKKPGPEPLARMQMTNIDLQPLPKPRMPKQNKRDLSALPRELRHRPTLMAGNTVPFIRYSGTRQPESLTRTLNGKLKQKLRREDRLELIKCYLGYAEMEDQLEDSLRKDAPAEWKQENPPDGVTWASGLKKATMEIEGQMFEQNVIAFHRTGELMKTIQSYDQRLKDKLREIKMEKKALKAESESKSGKDNTKTSILETPADAPTLQKGAAETEATRAYG
ncbi:hypothetical protein ABW19_dt0202489 [Dactylella cylindrospora]|nr:hypothetical protein ABW19_dt0202489 [Dactylella cylindrospora]